MKEKKIIKSVFKLAIDILIYVAIILTIIWVITTFYEQYIELLQRMSQ